MNSAIIWTNLHISLCCHSLAKQEDDLLCPGDISCHSLKNQAPAFTSPDLPNSNTTPSKLPPAPFCSRKHNEVDQADRLRAPKAVRPTAADRYTELLGLRALRGSSSKRPRGDVQAEEPHSSAPGAAAGHGPALLPLPESSSAAGGLTTLHPSSTTAFLFHATANAPSPSPAREQPAGTQARATAAVSPHGQSPPSCPAAQPHSQGWVCDPRSPLPHIPAP